METVSVPSPKNFHMAGSDTSIITDDLCKLHGEETFSLAYLRVLTIVNAAYETAPRI